MLVLDAGPSSFSSEKGSVNFDDEYNPFSEGSNLLEGHVLLAVELPTADPLALVIVLVVGTKLDTSVVMGRQKTDNLQRPPEVRIVNSNDEKERPLIVFQYAAWATDADATVHFQMKLRLKLQPAIRLVGDSSFLDLIDSFIHVVDVISTPFD